jgi:hypothetical protein
MTGRVEVCYMGLLKNILSIKYLPITLSVILIFILGLQKNYSPDAGFHLQSAKWMLENGKIITQDVFTYTSFGNDYFDLQWLYQLVLYGLYKLGKDELLVIFNSALISVSVLITWLRSKSESAINILPELFLLLIIIGSQSLMFEIRPHVFSWLFLSLILLVLADYKAGITKQVYILPFIMLFWVNFHSLAILGLVVIGIYVAGSYLEEKKVNKHLLQILLLSFASFLINPYFLEGFLFPFKQFNLIKSDATQTQYIAELQSPFTLSFLKQQGIAYLVNPLFYLQLYSLLVILAAVKLFRKKQFIKILLIFSFLVILHMAIKNYGYFFIVTLPFVISFLNEWFEERKKKKKWSETKFITRLRISSIGLAIVIMWLCITDGLSVLRQSPYRFGISIDEQSVPVEATAFLNRNKIYGKLLNHLDFGGYLMFNYPEKIFIDGRLELPKPELFKKYFNGLKAGGLESLLAEYDPEIIIFPFTKAVAWWSYLIKSKNYRAVYFDGLAAIYLKNGTFENVPALTEEMVKTNSTEDIYAMIQEDKPTRTVAVLKSFFQKQYFPIDEQNKATFCFTYGYGKAGLEYSAAGINKATVNPANIFYNLSLHFTDIKKYSEAAICAKKSK